MSDLTKETATAEVDTVKIGSTYVIVFAPREKKLTARLEHETTIAARLALAWNVLADAEALARAVIDDSSMLSWAVESLDLARALLVKIAVGEGSNRGT